MIQEINDEVIAGEALYTIESADGSVLQDNVLIKLKTPTVQLPTPLNRATLANLQGDLYAQDRYNVPVVALENFGKGPLQGDIIPKTWTKVSDTEYTADGVTLVASSINSTTSGYPYYACDGNASTQYKGKNSSSVVDRTLMWNFDTPQKITKMYVYIGTTTNLNKMTDDYVSITIQGSNTGTTDDEFIDLFSIPITNVSNYQHEIELTNADYYKYYRIKSVNTENSLCVHEWYVTEYEGDVYNYVNYLSLPLTSYEVGKIINIEGISYTNEGVEINSFDNPYININNLGIKRINGIIVSGGNYSLVYNGESFDISHIAQQFVPLAGNENQVLVKTGVRSEWQNRPTKVLGSLGYISSSTKAIVHTYTHDFDMNKIYKLTLWGNVKTLTIGSGGTSDSVSFSTTNYAKQCMAEIYLWTTESGSSTAFVIKRSNDVNETEALSIGDITTSKAVSIESMYNSYSSPEFYSSLLEEVLTEW